MPQNTEKRLKGKTVLVTGAAKRLGRAIALAAAQNGANIAITYRSSAREAGHTVVDAASLGVRAYAFECDVTDETSIRAMMKATIAEFGRLDVLVNNAANYETVRF